MQGFPSMTSMTNPMDGFQRGLMTGAQLGGRMRQARLVQERDAAAKVEADGRRQLADRIRAQLSPADTEAGSGTGAMPSLEQQMRVIEEAQLLNPEVAAQFAPLVQSRRLEGLMTGRPANERLAFMTNPEEAGKAYASQFRHEVMAPGSVRTEGDRIVAAAPVVQRFDDRFGSVNPMAPEQVTYTDPRAPTYAEQTGRMQADTGRIAAERPQIANLSPGQQAYGVDPYGGVSPLAENTNATAGQEAAELKREENAAKRMEAAASRQRQAANTIGTVDKALSQVNGWTAGPLAGLSGISGTPAADLAATIDTIEANLSFDALAEMRANSPTGGALGGIAVRELELLGATVASLRQSQSPAQLRQNLNAIKTHYGRYLRAVDEASQQEAGHQPQTSRPTQQNRGARRVSSRADYDALPSGATFIAPDGSTRRKP